MPRQPGAPEGQDHERPEVAVLAERLGDVLADPLLLGRALAHRSWCAEVMAGEPEQSTERLEFLGDAVLGLVVTDHLYRSYPELSEGQLAKTRASVVDADTLAEVAAELGIGAGLLLGKGEDASGGRQKASILADTMEAVIGAVYLDSGWEGASTLVLGLLANRLADAAEGPGGQDYKTRLQELTAGAFDQLPRYEVTSEGPDHAKRFFATVHVGGSARGRGEGRSKKRAEQVAARAAWEELAPLRAEQVPESRA